MPSEPMRNVRSAPDDRLQTELNRAVGKRVIGLVGNASSLLRRDYGALIDSGCVVRLNAGIPISSKAQGRRVDVHCFSNRPNLIRNLQLAKRPWFKPRPQNYFAKALPIWMHPEGRDLCEEPNQLYYPLEMWRSLREELGASPSVGAMTLHMLSAFTESPVRIFGFDFKASSSFYRKRENRSLHNWEAEGRLAHSLAEIRGWHIYL